MTAVVCERLVKVYRIGDADVTALNGLDLTVSVGEMVAVMGPSGCGKSTLLNIVGALDRPTTGTVTVLGVDLSAASRVERERFRRTQVGFVWQDTTRNLVPFLDARANVLLALDAAQAGRRRDRRSRAADLLDLVGLGERARHLPHELSGGQQRVAVAVALAGDPPLVLGDEPTGALDAETATEVAELLRSVRRELGTSIVVVSHDPNVAASVDRVIELRDGQSAQEHRGSIDGSGDRAVLLVDGVGRLRLPDSFRERLGIEGRVTAEVRGDEIVLRRPGGEGAS